MAEIHHGTLCPSDLTPEPELHPLYPSPNQISSLLSANSGLNPSQKVELVSHCLSRACLFGDLSLLQYLLCDKQAQSYVDLDSRDDDGFGLLSQTIQGFGAESERDVEREECVRLLIAQGADVHSSDQAGWTPLHHAALLAPPTLVSHLMTHGCSPFSVTHRQLTPLDIVTAHTVLPGREDIAILLEEAMRCEGWTGGRMEQRRRALDERIKRRDRRKSIRQNIAKIIEIPPQWWGDDESEISLDESDCEEDDDSNDEIYTPSLDFTSMLAWSPQDLHDIFETIIANFRVTARNTEPANALYLMARFAHLMCDSTWLEDLILGATDVIEEKFFNNSEDVTCLIFWLHNVTIWLHLMQCDNSINDACEMLGSFELLEQVVNSVFVFIIRFAERKIDQLLDAALLENSLIPADTVQFESEWSFLRPFTTKKKVPTSASNASMRNGISSPPPHLPARPPSPSIQLIGGPPATPKTLSSLRHTFSRAKVPTTPTNIDNLDSSMSNGLHELLAFLTALHILLTLSDINPVLITQFWSQVMYWTSSEMFNRILTRKKYLCRSRAIRIGMNLSALEDWVDAMNLPYGIKAHFSPVKDLLTWLQRLSSIGDFSDLVATIQVMRNINPLQMRRAVRDYKYEVSEGRMDDECIQYLTQLQKDWERHRVKIGVEAMRKELGEREHEREHDFDDSSVISGNPGSVRTPSVFTTEDSANQHGIDPLFNRTFDKSMWVPLKAPQVLGELLDSRHMLPLFLPSDPRQLSATPDKTHVEEYAKRLVSSRLDAHSAGYGSTHGPMGWKRRSYKVRNVSIQTLRWIDRLKAPSSWGRSTGLHHAHYGDDELSGSISETEGLHIDTNVPHATSQSTPLTRKPSTRSRSHRLSLGGDQLSVLPAS
ncbi:DIL domain-containing protein [Pisolithus marmoratus]|nr:DIL domain-containing protein [Pisolithus marmoratus]